MNFFFTDAKLLKLKHGGVLGLSACILAYPYQVPKWMPEILVHLGDYLHEAPQIQVSILVKKFVLLFVLSESAFF